VCEYTCMTRTMTLEVLEVRLWLESGITHVASEMTAFVFFAYLVTAHSVQTQSDLYRSSTCTSSRHLSHELHLIGGRRQSEKRSTQIKPH
jgi:hypothetical protein